MRSRPATSVEQAEAWAATHDVIAVPVDEADRIHAINLDEVDEALRPFIDKVFAHDRSRVLAVGVMTDGPSATALVRILLDLTDMD